MDFKSVLQILNYFVISSLPLSIRFIIILIRQ